MLTEVQAGLAQVKTHKSSPNYFEKNPSDDRGGFRMGYAA
jgi:hypothetical protein